MAKRLSGSKSSKPGQSSETTSHGAAAARGRNGHSSETGHESSSRSSSRSSDSTGVSKNRSSVRQQEQKREAFGENMIRARQSRQRTGSALLDAGSAVAEAVKQHAIPATLIGAGLAWLLLETRVAREAELRLLEQARSAAGKVGEAFSEFAETAKEAYGEASESTQEAISSAKESVKERAADLAEYARSGFSAVGEGAQTGYERGRDAIADTWDKHPLAVGVSLLAAGVATGLMLPASVRESNLLGDAASNLTKSVKNKSSELLEKSKELVSSSAVVMAREAKRYGFTGSTSARGRSGGKG